MLCALVLLTVSCGQRSMGRPSLRPVALPDLSKMEESVQTQVRARYQLATSKAGDPTATALDLASAYGDLGKLLMAAEYFDAAEPCFLNAQDLMPQDSRWTYYLGHLYLSKDQPDQAATFFEKTVVLQPNDEAASVSLGSAYLTLNRPDQAESTFTKALSIHPDSAAAFAGLGRSALAKKNYRRAARYLEEALTRSPESSSLQYPLAMAYRGLGDVEKVDAHLRLRGDIQVGMRDPLMKELADLLQSTLAYEIRGDQALEKQQWPEAVASFRQGVALAPDKASLRNKLGTALFMTGDAAAALDQLREALRLSPEFAKAHYSIGLIMASSGKHREALEEFSAAVKADPKDVQARLIFGDGLRASGRLEESLDQYAQVIHADPRVAEARFGSAMALVRLRRYQEARERLAEGTKLFPDRLDFPHALARLLVAAPDARLRNGQQAMSIMQGLIKRQQSIDLGETMAMTFAELGQYGQALAWQREAIAAAKQSGHDEIAKRMAANLTRYERNEPCRIPWQDDDPVHSPWPTTEAARPR